MQGFWNKVKKSTKVTSPHVDTPCWNWTASLRGGGYGQVKCDNTVQYAHRVSWVLHEGPIPDGRNVLHECNNKICVNPKHLYLK